MATPPKKRAIAVGLALVGTVLPVAGLHKFYLGQSWWGLCYLLLSWTPIPHVASAVEGIWYLAQDGNEFDQNFNAALAMADAGSAENIEPEKVGAIADALRALDTLRQDGLISEGEFEEKRRSLLDRIS
ncbi:MAG: NINE protein [Cyanobacteria bacterium P01_D01_bin.73]